MKYFLMFLGWAIVYSLFYFLSLDITGNPPGTEETVFHSVLNRGGLLIISIPVWWFTWKKFYSAFGPKKPVSKGGGATEYYFCLRNPELTYYLMVLKPFLLALGANGVITLSHHHGGARIFWICNFFVLYIYAIPYFIYKFRKLKKALATVVVVDDKKMSLQKEGHVISEILLNSIDRIVIEETKVGLLVEGGGSKIYVGGPSAGASSFYTGGAEELFGKLKQAAKDKITAVDSIKEELKKVQFKPFI